MTLVVGLDLTCLEATPETGVERYARRLAETLPKVAPHQRLVVFAREGAPVPVVPAPGIVATAKGRLGRALWREATLPSLVEEHGVRVLHSPVAAVSTLARARKIATIHDVPDASLARSEGGVFSRHRLRARHAVAVCDAIVTPSFAAGFALREAADVRGVRIDVVPHGVDPDFRPHGPSLNRERYGLPSGPYVLCVATLRARKDHETLVRAFAEAYADAPGFLVLAGKHAEDPAPLLSLGNEIGIGGRVFAPGYVSREDLPDLYREAAAFVLPSRLEGFGLTLLEAMASGTPTLGADAGSIPEVMAGAGIVFGPGDVRALARELRLLRSDGDRRESLRERGIKRAAEATWEASARRHAEIYEEVAAGAPAKS
jgi:glycosyltransferase involved in cell wall biosynthesis